MTHLVGAAFLGLHDLSQRARRKSFSLLAAGGFASFGTHTVVQPPLRLRGARHIALGNGVFVGPGSWLNVLDGADGVAIELGDRTEIVGNGVISAARSVRVGRDVLFARNVYVSDHAHAYTDVSRPIRSQGITDIAPVEICDGAWIGENVVVCPGVRIGRGAVIGANAVVKTDVPDHTVAVGAPARIVKTFGLDQAEPERSRRSSERSSGALQAHSGT